MKNLNIALYRDQAVIELVQEHGPLTAEQIHRLMFKHSAKARDRLHKLAVKGRIQRGRLMDNAFIYWDGDLPKNWNHAVMLNEFYSCLVAGKKSWMSIGETNREENCGSIVADMYLTVKLTLEGKYTKYFVEVDRNADIGRPQKKLTDLAKMFKSDDWHGAYWAQSDEPGVVIFPRIIMVVPEDKRRDALRKFAEKNMPREMKVKIASVQDVKKEVISLL